jgi:hypothetical protein
MTSLNERVAWTINYYKGKYNLSWPVLAKKLGTNKDTLAKYAKNLGGHIKGNVIDALANNCDFNPTWLIHGSGEPFEGAREKFPEVCGPEQRQPVELQAKITGDQSANYGVDAPYRQTIRQLDKIFDSRDPTFIQTVVAVLDSFGRAIEKNQELNNKINSLEKRISELEAGVQREGGNIQGDTPAEETGRSTEKKAG